MQQIFVKLHRSVYLSCNRILTSQSNIELLRRSNVMLSLLKKEKLFCWDRDLDGRSLVGRKSTGSNENFMQKCCIACMWKNPFAAPRVKVQGPLATLLALNTSMAHRNKENLGIKILLLLLWYTSWWWKETKILLWFAVLLLGKEGLIENRDSKIQKKLFWVQSWL